MGSSAINLSQPPMQPPDVSQQGGGSPYSQMGAVLAGQKPGGGATPGSSQPNPQLIAQGDAVKQILTQMSKTSDAFAPFASKAMQLIDAGLAQASGPSDSTAGPMGPGAPPPTGAFPFPG